MSRSEALPSLGYSGNACVFGVVRLEVLGRKARNACVFEPVRLVKRASYGKPGVRGISVPVRLSRGVFMNGYIFRYFSAVTFSLIT